MKYIQLKDNEGDSLYPYVKWETIEDKPSILNNLSPEFLTNLLLKSIQGYDNTKS